MEPAKDNEARNALKKQWLERLQAAWDSGEYAEDQYIDLKMEMTDELDFDECEEVLAQLITC